MFEIVRDNWELLLIGQYPNGPIGGLFATIGLAILSITLAFPLSILFALCRISKNKFIYLPVTAVVYVVRGLPLIMFIFWAYFLLPLILHISTPGFVTMVVALVIYESAYMSEIIRGSIRSLPSGQEEAGRSLGLNYSQTMRKVILPQALFNAIPSLLSQFISTLKETSLGYVISVQELTFAASQINNLLLTKPFEVFALLALTYFSLNLLLSGIVKLVESSIQKKRALI